MLGEEEAERGEPVEPGDPGAQQGHRWGDSGPMRGPGRVSRIILAFPENITLKTNLFLEFLPPFNQCK